MFKKVHLLLAGLLFSMGLHAQTAVKHAFPHASNTLQMAPDNRKTPSIPEISVPEPGNVHAVATHSGVNYRSNAEEVINELYWDAQSYGSIPQRLYSNDAGEPVAAWIFSKDQPGGYPERGTGVDTRTGGAWNNVTARAESIRTGFGAIARLDDGSDLAVAHATGLTPNQIHFSKRAPGATAWVESNLPNPQNVSLLWPCIDASGSTIHVLAISSPVANGGVLVDGVNGQLFYWRSTDGGQTWDRQQIKLPGVDATKLTRLGANQYTIHARGNTVAIAVLPAWNDLMVLKSTDNGTTWSQPVAVVDFPDAVENYEGLAGEAYTLDDIGGVPDPDRPNEADSLGIFSNDGFGSILIDQNNTVHLWYGRMYYIDNDVAAGTFYYPGVFGLNYWREDFGADSAQYITAPLDYNGNGILDIAGGEIGPYYNSLSGFPSSGQDEDGNIFLAYSAVHELYRSGESAEKDQFFRHVYLMQSVDGGNTWGDPLDVIAAPYLDETLAQYTEAVWPSIPRKVGSEVWLTYQSDYLPGTQTWGDNHTSQVNTLSFLSIPQSDISVGTHETPTFNAALAVQVMPNPVTDLAQVLFNLQGEGAATIQVYDVLGHLVYTTKLGATGAGKQSITVPMQGLSTGMYTIRLNEGNAFGIARVVKN